MPTLTPTKAAGATAIPNPVRYVDPAAQVTPEQLAATLPLDGVNAVFVADFLSGVLTHERCGTHLYRSVSARTENPVLRRKYDELGEETFRHVEILEELITAMGGNPNYVSTSARAVEAMDSRLLDAVAMSTGGLDLMTAEMAMLDAVFVAESVDHANWETMAMLAGSLPAGPAREAWERAVGEVRPQEDEHLEWARSTKARLVELQVESSALSTAGAKLEEMVAAVRNWLS